MLSHDKTQTLQLDKNVLSFVRVQLKGRQALNNNLYLANTCTGTVADRLKETESLNSCVFYFRTPSPSCWLKMNDTKREQVGESSAIFKQTERKAKCNGLRDVW